VAIPTSGALAFSALQTEFGGTNPIAISEYYAGGGLVPAGSSGTNGDVPSSGTIAISKFYGTENVVVMVASGGTVTTSGDFKIHTFTGDGCFVVSTVGNPAGSNSVEYLVVAGGGGAAGGSPGAVGSGGGGAGAVGANAGPPLQAAGNGGNGATSNITGSCVTYAGGGGGSGEPGASTPNTTGGNGSTSGGGGSGTGTGGGDSTGQSTGSSGGYNDGNYCFDPSTPIQMADGSTKQIKNIQLGDDTKGGEVTGVFQFKASDEIHDYKGVTVAGSHYVKEDGKFIMVKDSLLSVKIDKIPVVYSLDTTGRRIFINDIEFADYNGDGVAKNFLTNAGVDLTGFDTEVLRQVENRLI